MINDTNETESITSSVKHDTSRKRVGFLQDQNGANSSKRLCGVILLGIGILMGIALFVFGLQEPTQHYESSYDVMQGFLIAGTSLLGLGLIDNLNKIFEKNKRNP